MTLSLRLIMVHSSYNTGEGKKTKEELLLKQSL